MTNAAPTADAQRQPLQFFHPAVARWFAQSLGPPTAAQRLGWDEIRKGRHTLIAAPTGSGKTLAAFLIAIDDLLREGLEQPLPAEVRVLYVSPLKALSGDIHKNLMEPLAGVERIAAEMGLAAPRITAAVRTGDTPAAARAAMLRTPPHLLVTTPESLYLLLTSAGSRERLRHVCTVIVDEIHALIGGRRGAHLALSLERLAVVTTRPPLRIGLSATQRPVEEVARFLVGTDHVDQQGRAACAVIDEGHRRRMELALEVPGSPLEAVMSHEVWQEYYERLAVLIAEHRTTLVFVNTRKMAERLARELADRLGEDQVAAHHGSLSKERRFDAETRLKHGRVKVVVATASLELGIDIGHIDLVCQIGSPRRIAVFLQRVGRAGHTIHGTAKGRLFPETRDDLVECAALLAAVRRGELDRLVSFDEPHDVLAQQIVAEVACCEWREDELFATVRRAWPYRALSRRDFDAVVRMLTTGFTARRGLRPALLHRDEVQSRLIGRRAARLTALTSGGAIPDSADYRVVLEPDDLFLGTLNEDFAIESNAGDVFQLGNSSWRILQVTSGVVRVADAHGAPPTIPFWLGEAPGRSAELSSAVSDLRRQVESLLTSVSESEPDPTARATAWLVAEAGVSAAAADQIVAYLADTLRVLGALPTQQTLILERFFDESGGMQLVLHAPFGSRVNRAWALALRKRFCRQFNFELQAAATEEGLLLSLGPQHSFPLADVFRYLSPASVRDVLVQAFLDAPVFKTRWRWNATVSLAVPRAAGGRRVPAPLQRMRADDLLAAAFPDAAACLENIPGDRQIPDHPLVNQTVRDCLEEAMDLPRLTEILDLIHNGAIRCLARDTAEPSALSHGLLNARPYAFLDDAPLEERRAHAVQARRATDPTANGGLGLLNPEVIARVTNEAWPDPRDPDELHDALVTAGFFTDDEVSRDARWRDWLTELGTCARAVQASANAWAVPVWVAAERLPELRAAFPSAALASPIEAPAERAAVPWTQEAALTELLKGRMAMLGPLTAERLGWPVGLSEATALPGLIALESEGLVLRGVFDASGAREQWCDRRLLARIHRETLTRLRADIEPITPAEFMRFLFAWQHVTPIDRLAGVEGLRVAVSQLDGFELAAAAWERHVLPARVERYDPSMLDQLCFSGEVGWARLGPTRANAPAGTPSRPIRATPVSVFQREHLRVWQALSTIEPVSIDAATHSAPAQALLTALDRAGASFIHELTAEPGLGSDTVQAALGELVAAGAVTSDGFGGLRALVAPKTALVRHALGFRPRSRARVPAMAGGRWARLSLNGPSLSRDEAVQHYAMTLLARYGVMFRRLLSREPYGVPWRELVRVYRRLEARGEIRGGRFVAGMSGEQFALPDAVERAREIRRRRVSGDLVTVSAADPLNLAGIVTGGERIAAVASTRVVFCDGIPVEVTESQQSRRVG